MSLWKSLTNVAALAGNVASRHGAIPPPRNLVCRPPGAGRRAEASHSACARWNNFSRRRRGAPATDRRYQFPPKSHSGILDGNSDTRFSEEIDLVGWADLQGPPSRLEPPGRAENDSHYDPPANRFPRDAFAAKRKPWRRLRHPNTIVDLHVGEDRRPAVFSLHGVLEGGSLGPITSRQRRPLASLERGRLIPHSLAAAWQARTTPGLYNYKKPAILEAAMWLLSCPANPDLRSGW